MLLAASFVPLYTLYLSAAKAVHPFFLVYAFFLQKKKKKKLFFFNNKLINYLK